MTVGLSAAICVAGCLDFEQYEFREGSAPGSGSSVPESGNGGGASDDSDDSGDPGGSDACDPSQCSGTCTGGRCVECQAGSVACLNDTQYRECSLANVWSEVKNCEDQACSASGCRGVCAPGQTRCSGPSAVQTCTDQGQWGTAQPCESSCAGVSCRGECTVGERGCRDGNTRQQCTEGQWQTTDCDVACDEDSGECVECVDNSQRCDPNDPSRIQVCIAGAWQGLQACDRGCRENPATRTADCNDCSLGQTRCSYYPSDVRQECNAAGEWEDVETCPYVCSGGVCSGVCEPNAQECTAGVPEYCTASGTWRQEPCPTGMACAGPYTGCI